MADQKNEWAEIYGAQKQQFEKQQREIGMLTQEIQRIQKSRDNSNPKLKGSASQTELNEAVKRLKKRELEC